MQEKSQIISVYFHEFSQRKGVSSTRIKKLNIIHTPEEPLPPSSHPAPRVCPCQTAGLG